VRFANVAQQYTKLANGKKKREEKDIGKYEFRKSNS
jgi:hypothetical protein